MRGPDWEWGDQDGGKGSIGTVTDTDDDDGWVKVKWDSNSSNNSYRVGHNGKFDLVEGSRPRLASTTTVEVASTTHIHPSINL